MPRDERGWTLPVEGEAGEERPGTTLEPRWLIVRGLEIEREVKVYVTQTDAGYDLHETSAGALDYWFSRLSPGDKIVVWIDGVFDFPGAFKELEETPVMSAVERFIDDAINEALDSGRGMPVLANARLTQHGALAFDRPFPDWILSSALCIKLTRVRGVPSCALDEVQRLGKMSNEQTGDAIGRHRTLVARELKDALRKACETAEDEFGIEREDFVATLMMMGDVNPG